MSRAIAFSAALLVGWGFYAAIRADEPVAGPPSLPPSASASPEQVEIESRLRQPVMIDLVEVSLESAVAQIAERNGIDLRLDARGLADAVVDPNVLVTFKTNRPLPLTDALQLMLKDYELTAVPANGVILITSREKEERMLMTRIYPVEDIVGGGLAYGADRYRASLGPLLRVIQDTIQPDSWDCNSGVGAVQPFFVNGGWTLVISNTYRVQTEVATLLADLRAVRHENRVIPRTRTIVP
ncbi:MAG TPA: hypothetical protein VGJ26_01030 [Pirellulales bacterium]|jgi:hypothetical protein